jgi:hypothetical protein
MKHSLHLLAAAVIAAIGYTAVPALADDDRGDLRALSAQWWQWALSIPTATNPLPDLTGSLCMAGQRGPVWFLAGTISASGAPAPVVRTCDVPEGTALFFPVVNAVNFNSPGCGQEDRNLSVPELRALVAPGIDAASGLSVLLDNRPVRPRRVRSVPFAVTLPPQDLFSVTFGIPCLVPGRVYSPAVDDGYYVLLTGLSVGQHHLSFRGSIPGFSLDVFYTLNVREIRFKQSE